MARHSTLDIPAQIWTELTNSNITAATFCVVGGDTCFITATTGAAPSSIDGAIPMAPQNIVPATMTLADLFPGAAGANRLWAFSYRPNRVMISHA